MQYEYDPEQLREKMNAGLSREQALDVLSRQAECDTRGGKQPRKAAKPVAADK